MFEQQLLDTILLSVLRPHESPSISRDEGGDPPFEGLTLRFHSDPHFFAGNEVAPFNRLQKHDTPNAVQITELGEPEKIKKSMSRTTFGLRILLRLLLTMSNGGSDIVSSLLSILHLQTFCYNVKRSTNISPIFCSTFCPLISSKSVGCDFGCCSYLILILTIRTSLNKPLP